MAISNKVYTKSVTFDVICPFSYHINNSDDSKSTNNIGEFCTRSSIIRLGPFEFTLEVHPFGYGEDNIGYLSVFLIILNDVPQVPKSFKDFRVSYCVSLLNAEDGLCERLPKKGYTSHGFRSQSAWGYKRFLSLDELYSRHFIFEDSLLKFRVTINIEVDDYDFDRYTLKDSNDDDYCIVNEFQSSSLM